MTVRISATEALIRARSICDGVVRLPHNMLKRDSTIMERNPLLKDQLPEPQELQGFRLMRESRYCDLIEIRFAIAVAMDLYLLVNDQYLVKFIGDLVCLDIYFNRIGLLNDYGLILSLAQYKSGERKVVVERSNIEFSKARSWKQEYLDLQLKILEEHGDWLPIQLSVIPKNLNQILQRI